MKKNSFIIKQYICFKQIIIIIIIIIYINKQIKNINTENKQTI